MKKKIDESPTLAENSLLWLRKTETAKEYAVGKTKFSLSLDGAQLFLRREGIRMNDIRFPYTLRFRSAAVSGRMRRPDFSSAPTRIILDAGMT